MIILVFKYKAATLPKGNQLTVNEAANVTQNTINLIVDHCCVLKPCTILSEVYQSLRMTRNRKNKLLFICRDHRAAYC